MGLDPVLHKTQRCASVRKERYSITKFTLRVSSEGTETRKWS